MRLLLIATRTCLLAALVLVPGPARAQLSSTQAPETFIATAQVAAVDAGLTATVTIHIEKYSPETDLKAMQEALRTGGYDGFLPVLRKAPEVGYIELNKRRVATRWARQLKTEKGRTISVVADAPLFFLGGGNPDAKPRAGYELTIITLDVDAIGLGSGSMAAAARVRPGGPTGVQVDDYGEKPVPLKTVRKAYRQP
jgi:hypothetical protein